LQKGDPNYNEDSNVRKRFSDFPVEPGYIDVWGNFLHVSLGRFNIVPMDAFNADNPNNDLASIEKFTKEIAEVFGLTTKPFEIKFDSKLALAGPGKDKSRYACSALTEDVPPEWKIGTDMMKQSKLFKGAFTEEKPVVIVQKYCGWKHGQLPTREKFSAAFESVPFTLKFETLIVALPGAMEKPIKEFPAKK